VAAAALALYNMYYYGYEFLPLVTKINLVELEKSRGYTYAINRLLLETAWQMQRTAYR
jgi:hypothetical protein